MLVADIVKLEPGTLIKGFKVSSINAEGAGPRIATFNVDGWEFPEPNYEIETIRTMFYPLDEKPSWIKTHTPATVKKHGIKKIIRRDPFLEWGGHELLEFKKGSVVGLHMGEFIFAWLSKRQDIWINLYTKVLLVDGRLGFLVLETDNRHTMEAELI